MQLFFHGLWLAQFGGGGNPSRCIKLATADLDNRLTDGEIVSLTRRPDALYPPGRFLVLISVESLSSPTVIMRRERLNQMKNPVTW
jgi:hypothetical protein